MTTTLVNGCSFVARSGGNGSFVFGSARLSWLTPAQAVAQGQLSDGQTVAYVAQDTVIIPTQRAWGHGVFSAASNTIARDVSEKWSSKGATGTGPLDFQSPPIVLLTVLASDIVPSGSSFKIDTLTRVTSNSPTTANDAIVITNSAFGTAGAAIHILNLGDSTQPSPAGLWIRGGEDCSSQIWNNAAYIFPATWSSGTTYSVGQVVAGSDTFVYTSLVNGNVGNNPVGDGGVHWQNRGSTIAADEAIVWEDKTQYATGIELGEAGVGFWISTQGDSIGGEIAGSTRLQRPLLISWPSSSGFALPSLDIGVSAFNINGGTFFIRPSISGGLSASNFAGSFAINSDVAPTSFPNAALNVTPSGGGLFYWYNGRTTFIGGIGQSGAWEGNAGTDFIMGGPHSLKFYTNNSVTAALVLDASNRANFATGANATVVIGSDAAASTYNLISLNGQNTDGANANLGFVGGATGDNTLYYETPSGGGHTLNVGSAAAAIINATGAKIGNAGLFSFASTASAAGAGADTGISRIAPVSSVPTIAIGNGSAGDASATIKAKTKAGAPTATDVPSGTWALIRDTTNATTKLYYNNAGTLQTVSLV